MGQIGEYHKDIKAHRKRKREGKDKKQNQKKNQIDEPPRRRCWDWMITTGNCHYAKNRSSFKEYRRVGKSIPNGVIEGITTFVAGVGTVELKVQTTREEGSPVRTLVLEDVLHIPEAKCNGFSVALYHTLHGGSTRLGLNPSGTDDEYNPLWCGEQFKGLAKLVLAGNPQGESYLGDGIKMLSMYIDDKDLEEIVGPREEEGIKADRKRKNEEKEDDEAQRKRTKKEEDAKPCQQGKVENESRNRDCGDWMVVSGNCHYATDRSYFKDYREVGIAAQNYASIEDMVYVAGIGTVELKVQAGHERGSPIRTLVLKNVLHVPHAECNGFAFIEYHKIYGSGNRPNSSEGLDEDGRLLWCSKIFQGLAHRLILPGNPRGGSYRDRDLRSLDIYIEKEDMLEISISRF